MSECICEPGTSCGATGMVEACVGCGGDLCVCAACNGWGMNEEIECPGCIDCAGLEDEDDAGESGCGSPWCSIASSSAS